MELSSAQSGSAKAANVGHGRRVSARFLQTLSYPKGHLACDFTRIHVDGAEPHGDCRQGKLLRSQNRAYPPKLLVRT